jgi:radical SAM protein with 4Fe4S-binding SPASM domain
MTNLRTGCRTGDGAGDVRLRDFPALVTLEREAARRRALAARPDLDYLFWEATLRCNLRCRHCGSSCEARSPHHELATPEILAILETVAEDFDPARVFVSITGGEPLLREDLLTVVARLTALGFCSSMVTNGMLLDGERARRVRDAGMSTVSISVDGTGAQHDEIRGPGTHRRALEALGHAREAGFELVEAITCARPANLDALPAIERAVRAAGATAWRVVTIDRMGRQAAAPDPTLWLEPAQVRRLLDHVAARREALTAAGDAEFTVSYSCGGFLGVRREGSVRRIDAQCHAGLSVASILCDGLVGACPSLPRSWAQGSARERRFSEIWRDAFRLHRDPAWRRTGRCGDCSWFSTCLGGGLHERLAQPDDFCWLDRQDG